MIKRVPNLWLLPVLAFIAVVTFAAIGLMIASDVTAAVGTHAGETQDRIDARVTISLMRWTVTWAGTNVALLGLVGVSIHVIRRATDDRSIQVCALVVPVVLLIALVVFMLVRSGSDFTLGPRMTSNQDAVSREARDWVQRITDPLMLLAVLYAVAGCAVLTHEARNVEVPDAATTSRPNDAADEPRTSEATKSAARRKQLLALGRLLVVTASVTLVFGAAEVQALFSIPVAEQPEREYLQEVADAWGMTTGAFYSLLLLALSLPLALRLRAWQLDGTGGRAASGSAESPAGAGASAGAGLVTLMRRVEPVLVILAPFLSAILAQA